MSAPGGSASSAAGFPAAFDEDGLSVAGSRLQARASDPSGDHRVNHASR